MAPGHPSHRDSTFRREWAGFAGGIITAVGLPYFDRLIDKPSGRFVVRGIPLELLVATGRRGPGPGASTTVGPTS